MTIEQDDTAVPTVRGITLWLTPAAMILYSILKFGAGSGDGGIIRTVGALALSYMLAVYLYYAIARLACRRQYSALWIGGLAAVACGYLLSGPVHIRDLLFDWSMILVTGAIVGRLMGRQTTNQRAYVVGLLSVAFFGVLLLSPQWSRLVNMTEMRAGDLIQSLQSGLPLDLLGAAGTTYGHLIERAWLVFIRLLPGFLILSFIVQYSAGFLWFSSAHARERGEPAAVNRLLFFRVPRMIAGVVLVCLVTRFVFGETAQLVADNVIAALSFFYCVAGTAILEYHMRRGGLHWMFKVITYVLLTMIGIIGFAALVLVGMVNSLREWRVSPAVD